MLGKEGQGCLHVGLLVRLGYLLALGCVGAWVAGDAPVSPGDPVRARGILLLLLVTVT